MTRKSDAYEFDGNLSGVPQPVNVGIGATIKDDLTSHGILAGENISNAKNVKMLLSRRLNSITMNPLLAKEFNSHGKSAGRLKIHSIPLRSKSYFLIFSKKGQFSFYERKQIWSAIITVRDNEEWMLNMLHRYEK